MSSKKKRSKNSKKITPSSIRNSIISTLRERKALALSLFAITIIGLTQVPITSAISSYNVLGVDDENKQEEKRPERKQDEQKPEEQKRENVRSEEKIKNAQPNETRNKSSEIKRVEKDIKIDIKRIEKKDEEKRTQDKLNQVNIQKNETEIQTADGQRIKTKIEDDGTKKIEMEGRDYKLKYVVKNGKLKVEAKTENGEDIDIPNEASTELEDSLNDELEKEGIEVNSSTEEPTIVKNGFKARTAFPLTINPLTKTLTVTTPAGEREVAILPDVAIENLKASGVISSLDGADSSSPEGSSEIIEYKDKMAYKISGTKRHRVFGFIPVNLPITAYVSAETGEPLEKQQSLFTNIVDSISL